MAFGILIHLDCRFLYLFLSLFDLRGLGDLFGSLGPFPRRRTLHKLVNLSIVYFVSKLRSGLGGAGLSICDSRLLDKLINVS